MPTKRVAGRKPPKGTSQSNRSASRAGKQAGKKSTSTIGSTNRWTFLTNHAHVLIVLNAEPDVVLREVAHRVGITERAVQRIIQDLEAEGFIKIEKVGRKNRYQVRKKQPLRHPIEAHRDIGDLLELING